MATIQTAQEFILNVTNNLRIPNITGTTVPTPITGTTDLFFNTDTHRLAYKSETDNVINIPLSSNPTGVIGIAGGINGFTVGKQEFFYLSGPTSMTGAQLAVPGDTDTTLTDGDFFSVRSRLVENILLTITPAGSTLIENFGLLNSSATGSFSNTLDTGEGVSYIYDEDMNTWMVSSSVGPPNPGDVDGPSSSTDNAIAIFDGTTGKIIQNSTVLIEDDGALIITHNSNSDLNIIIDPEGRNGAPGASISKPGLSGFLSLMPNSESVQWIAGNPSATSGVNDFYIDVDNQGILRLNTLGGAGALGEIIATSGAPLRPAVDGTSDLGTATYKWNNVYGTTIHGDGSNLTGIGDVVGPGSSTDNAVVRFDSTTGKLIQNSTVIIDDNGAVSGLRTIEPSTTLTWNLGSASNKWNWIYGTRLVTENGTAAQPSHSFSSDADCGMWRSATNTISFGTAGVKSYDVMPSGLLTVNSALNYETLVVADDDIPNKKYCDDNFGSGDVSGPGSSTDNYVVRFDGTTGKIIQGPVAGQVSYDDVGSFTVDINSAGQYAAYLTNNAAGGDILNCQNHLSNNLLQIRANGSGDGILEVFTNSGNSPLLVDSGSVKIGNTTAGITGTYDLFVDGRTKIAGDLIVEDSKTGYILEVHNMRSATGGNGFIIMAGERLGDIAFHVADQDNTFQIMELEADQGYITCGKTYAQTLSDNGVVYGIDIQHSGVAKDFNTQSGVYRIAGVDVVDVSQTLTNKTIDSTTNTVVADSLRAFYAASEGESSTTSTTLQTKVTLNPTIGTAGTYRLGYTMEVSNSANGVLSEIEVMLDGVVVALPTMEADNDYLAFAGFVHQSLSTGSRTATIKYRVQTTGTCLIRRARLELSRVS